MVNRKQPEAEPQQERHEHERDERRHEHAAHELQGPLRDQDRIVDDGADQDHGRKRGTQLCFASARESMSSAAYDVETLTAGAERRILQIRESRPAGCEAS